MTFARDLAQVLAAGRMNRIFFGVVCETEKRPIVEEHGMHFRLDLIFTEMSVSKVTTEYGVPEP